MSQRQADGDPLRPITTHVPELRIVIPDELDRRLEAATPEYLDRKGFVCLLLDKALDTPRILTERAPASVVSSSSSSSSKKRINTVSLLEQIPVELAPHKALIEEFWRGKKGAKSETAWGLLIDNLTKIRSKYGAQVLEEQLKLGINGKWQSITLRNLENFAGTTAIAAQTGEIWHA